MVLIGTKIEVMGFIAVIEVSGLSSDLGTGTAVVS